MSRSLLFIASLLFALLIAVVSAQKPGQRRGLRAGDDNVICVMPDVYRVQSSRDVYIRGDKTTNIKWNRYAVDMNRGVVRVDTVFNGDSRGNLTSVSYQKPDPEGEGESIYFEYNYDNTGFCSCSKYPGSKQKLQNPLAITQDYQLKGQVIWRGLRLNSYLTFVNTGKGRNFYRMNYVLPNQDVPQLCQFMSTFEMEGQTKADTYDQDIFYGYEPEESDPKDFELPSRCPKENDCRLA